jgi:hypothetical protein
LWGLFWPKSAPGGPGKGPRLGPRSICTDFQPGRPILRLFRAAFRTPCDCIGGDALLAFRFRRGGDALLAFRFRRVYSTCSCYGLYRYLTLSSVSPCVGESGVASGTRTQPIMLDLDSPSQHLRCVHICVCTYIDIFAYLHIYRSAKYWHSSPQKRISSECYSNSPATNVIADMTNIFG